MPLYCTVCTPVAWTKTVVLSLKVGFEKEKLEFYRQLDIFYNLE